MRAVVLAGVEGRLLFVVAELVADVPVEAAVEFEGEPRLGRMEDEGERAYEDAARVVRDARALPAVVVDAVGGEGRDALWSSASALK